MPETEYQVRYGVTKEEAEAELQKIQRKVFIYDTTQDDIEHMHQSILSWLENNRKFDDEYLHDHKEFTFRVLWYLNNRGKTTKYLFFNERKQRLFLDRDFYEWFKIKTNLVEFNLERYKEVQ